MRTEQKVRIVNPETGVIIGTGRLSEEVAKLPDGYVAVRLDRRVAGVASNLATYPTSWVETEGPAPVQLRVGQRVRLVEHPKLKDISGLSGLVLKIHPKTIAILLDRDAEQYGKDLIFKKDEARYLAGVTVKTVAGNDLDPKLDKPEGAPEGAIAFGVTFYQLAEDWAVYVFPVAIKEVIQ